MSVFHNNALIGAGGGAVVDTTANITKSLRFEPTNTAYLSRTPSSAGNRRTWTVSLWLKRSKLGTNNQHVLETASSPEYSGLWFAQDDSLEFRGFNGSSYTYRLHTSQKFRDPGAWYHIVLNFDSTAATASDRLAMYVNGVEVTDFANTVYPSQNHDSNWNNTSAHYIATFVASSNYFGGYIADLYSIDGSVLGPSSFGAFDSNGVWQASAYSGTYGTNGFHLLDFENESTIGHDSSGNENDFTANNLTASTPGLTTADDGHDVLLWSGNNSSGRSITGLSFTPGLVVIKNRTNTSGYGWVVVDIARTAGRYLRWDASTPESVFGYVSALNSGGFTISNHREVNGSGDDYVGFCWRAGGSASSNTDGTITSNVSVNTTYGFSALTYSGNNTSGATVGHGLGAVPKWCLIKTRDQSGQHWHVYHASLAANEYIYLNLQNAKTSGNDFMNGTRPTSSVFTLGNGQACNKSGDDVVAYCWSEISGFSKFDSYTGTSSTVTVTTGFKPKTVIVKNVTTGSLDWVIVDSKRSNADAKLFPNNGEEESAQDAFDFNDDGFTIKVVDHPMNKDGDTFIYAAFAQSANPGDLDVLFDVPINDTENTDSGVGGEISGNYCTLNPLHTSGMNAGTGAAVLSNGNLDATSNTSAYKNNFGTIAFPASGKYYFEVTVESNNGTNNQTAGIAATTGTAKKYLLDCFATSSTSKRKLVDSSATSLSGSFNVGDVIGVAVDCDAGTAVIKHNNTDIDSGYTLDSSLTYAPFFSGYNCGTSAFNFGQRAWVYSAPSNHVALNTAALPSPTIADGSDQFETKLYTANATARSLTGYEFAPDWLWFKPRNVQGSHNLYDAVRGATKGVRSHATDAEYTDAQTVTSFNSDGFSLGTDSNGYQVNYSNNSMVVWAWNAGANSNKTYTVKVVSDSGNKYRFDDFGTSAVTLDLAEGSTYVFDQSDSSNSGHPLRFSTTSDGTHNSGTEYTTGVTTTGTPGSAGAKTTIVVASGAPVLHYYCSAHSGMGGQANTNSTAGSSNFDGSIQTTVKANPEAGFSIVTGTTPATNTFTIGHGLNAEPYLIIVKARNQAYNWDVYHKSLGNTGRLILNDTNASSTQANAWGSTTPTSSVFTMGGNGTWYNNGDTFVAYCISPVAGYSAVGSYTGNGSTDGPFAHINFAPAFVLIKATGASTYWNLKDNKRYGYNPVFPVLHPNRTDAEGATQAIDLCSNGFKIRSSDGGYNTNGGDYIYVAFASNPFQSNGGLAR